MSGVLSKSASAGELTGRSTESKMGKLKGEPSLPRVKSGGKKVFDVQTGRLRDDVLSMELERRAKSEARSQTPGKRDVDIASSVGYRLQRAQVQELLRARAEREQKLLSDERALYELKRGEIENEIMRNVRRQKLQAGFN